MRVELDCEIKGIGFKPVRKNKSELEVKILTESYEPGTELQELLNKNGKVVKVIFMDSDNEDEINMEARDR